MPIRTFALAALAASFAATGSLASTAPMTQAQAKAHCAAQYKGAAGLRTADRTGVTVSQQVAACVKKMTTKQGN